MQQRRTRSEWTRLVDAMHASGESVRDYATSHGLNLGTLKWWAGRLRRGNGGPVRRHAASSPAPAALGLVELALPVLRPPQDGVVAIARPTGVRVDLGATVIRFEQLPSPTYLAAMAVAFTEARS